MDAEKMSVDEFKERVVKLMLDRYADRKDEDFLRQCVNDEYFADTIEDGYNYQFGIESGIRYAARNISLCI